MKKLINKLKENRAISMEFNDRMKEVYRLEVEEGIEPKFDDPKDEKYYKTMRNTWNKSKLQFSNLKFIAVVFLAMILTGSVSYFIVTILQLPILLTILILISYIISICLVVKRKDLKKNISVYFLLGMLFSSFSSAYLLSGVASSSFKDLGENIVIIVSVGSILYSIYLNYNFNKENLNKSKTWG